MNSFLLNLLLICSIVPAIKTEAWPAIVDGKIENDWIPYLVSINYNNSGDLGLMGGGIAINEHYVITAGHLLDEFPEDEMPHLAIGYGSNNRDEQTHTSVEGFVTYMNRTTRLNDLAIIRVKPFDWNLVTNDSGHHLNLTIKDIGFRQTVTLVGWGAEKEPNGSPQDRLLTTTLMENPHGECVREMLTPEYMKTHPLLQISMYSSFCLHSKTSSPCYGDSGSPVFTIKNGDLNFYGVVSWGSSNCKDGDSTVFTRAYHYREAIEKITGFKRFAPADVTV